MKRRDPQLFNELKNPQKDQNWLNESIFKLSKNFEKTVKVSSVGIEQKNVDVPRGPP